MSDSDNPSYKGPSYKVQSPLLHPTPRWQLQISGEGGGEVVGKGWMLTLRVCCFVLLVTARPFSTLTFHTTSVAFKLPTKRVVFQHY